MANKRWTCPQCDRPGILAPGRMRKVDVRRYCLPCSEATGKLVERVCPALERKREAARAEQAERAVAKRKAKARATRNVRAARRAIKRAVKLKAFAREGVVPRERDLRIIDAGDTYSSGQAGRHGGFVKIGRRSTVLHVEELVVHELCHVVLHRLGREVKGARGHGRGFQSLLLAACAEFFKLTRNDEAAVLREWKVLKSKRAECQRVGVAYHRIDAYLLDDAIIDVIHKKRLGVLTLATEPLG